MLVFSDSHSGAGPSARKQPQQRRARDTVGVIHEAAARVLATRGHARTTTNHIAAVAGVSIGSLYQYFPDKNAICAALEIHHIEAAGGRLLELVRRLRARRVALGTWCRRFVRAVVAENDQPQHRELYSAVARSPQVQASLEGLVHALAAELAPLLLGRDRGLRARVGIVAGVSLVHELVIMAPRSQRGRATREVVALVARYLDGGPSPCGCAGTR